MEQKTRLEKIKKALNTEILHSQIAEIEKQSAQPDFWQNHQTASNKMQELANMQKIVQEIEDLESRIPEAEFGTEDPQINTQLHQLELRTFLSDKHDQNNAILSIHAGQGGTEAMDWVTMLLRMYLKYCDHKGWKTEIIQETPGEEAGIKSVSTEISGKYVYGYLKHEHGTHRLVRKSPFNADHLRQTSFALVEVIPAIEENTELELFPEDVEIQTFRSSGPGGQHANKTESAVRAIHKPTGLTVNVSNSRSQLTNRKTALGLLRGKLYQLMKEQEVEKLKELKGKFKPATWGTQIRSYVLDPYQLVKDHRTQVEVPQTEDVLNGKLDELIEAEIQQITAH
ncbi:peptide chain release factor 2 [Patescibacteria group bacterium]|nr:peptide chain release factor 2 [Patescibacteria group bacterium]